jgi:hypothetical protein
LVRDHHAEVPTLYTGDDPFPPKPPTHRDVANDILKAYGGGTPASAANGSVAFSLQAAMKGDNGSLLIEESSLQRRYCISIYLTRRKVELN